MNRRARIGGLGALVALIAVVQSCGPPAEPTTPAESSTEGPALVACLRPLDPSLDETVSRVLALRTAAWAGDGARVKACLAEGADPNFAWPGASRWHEITRLVLEAGASPHGPEGDSCAPCVAAGIAFDNCPLCDAARHGSPEVVTLLVASGAEPDAAEWPSGARPLHFAAQRHALEVMRALTESGADVEARDAEGRTALMYAVTVLSEDLLPVVRLLLAVGADPRTRDDEGRSALELARETLGDRASAVEAILGASTRTR